jgi:hypothetical protein
MPRASETLPVLAHVIGAAKAVPPLPAYLDQSSANVA